MFYLKGSARRAILLTGHTANGKSVFLQFLDAVLRDSCLMPLSPSAFITEQNSFNAAHLEATATYRCHKVSDVSFKKISLSTLLRVTGGDSIDVRHPYATRTVRIDMRAPLVIATNETPDKLPYTEAVADRLYIIPFRSRYYTEQDYKKTNMDVTTPRDVCDKNGKLNVYPFLRDPSAVSQPILEKMSDIFLFNALMYWSQQVVELGIANFAKGNPNILTDLFSRFTPETRKHMRTPTVPFHMPKRDVDLMLEYSIVNASKHIPKCDNISPSAQHYQNITSRLAKSRIGLTE